MKKNIYIRKFDFSKVLIIGNSVLSKLEKISEILFPSELLPIKALILYKRMFKQYS